MAGPMWKPFGFYLSGIFTMTFVFLETQVGLELAVFSPLTQFPIPGITGIHYSAHLLFLYS